MSKSTETTNDRVPRVLVRFGKHPSSVWKHHRACGNTIKCMETPSSVWKHSSSVWKHPSIVGKHSSSVWKHHRAWGNTIERGETLVSRGAYRGVAEGDRGVAEG